MDWNTVPIELLIVCLMKLDRLSDLFSASLVNRQWQQTTSHQCLWRVFHNTSFGSCRSFEHSNLGDWKNLVKEMTISVRNVQEGRCISRSLSCNQPTISETKLAEQHAATFHGDYAMINWVETDTERMDTGEDFFSRMSSELINLKTEERIRGPYGYSLFNHYILYAANQIALHVMHVEEISFAKFNGRYPHPSELKPFPAKLHSSSFAYIISNSSLESSIIVIVYTVCNSCANTFCIYNVDTEEILSTGTINKQSYTLLNDDFFVVSNDSEVSVLHIPSSNRTVFTLPVQKPYPIAFENKIILFARDKFIISWDYCTGSYNMTPFPLSFPQEYRAVIKYGSLIVCARSKALYAFDMRHPTQPLRIVPIKQEEEDLCELTWPKIHKLKNGCLIHHDAMMMAKFDFREDFLSQRIAVMVTSPKYMIQFVEIYAYQMQLLISTMVTKSSNTVSFYSTGDKPTERYGVVCSVDQTQQHRKRNELAIQAFEKKKNRITVENFQQECSTFFNSNCYPISLLTNILAANGTAITFYEEVIDGEWKLSTPSQWHSDCCLNFKQ